MAQVLRSIFQREGSELIYWWGEEILRIWAEVEKIGQILGGLAGLGAAAGAD